MTRSRAVALLVPTLLVLVAGVLRVANLDDPSRIIFDETYYVNDARAYLETGVEEGFAVHPPVGKWLIAAGIAALGDDAVGWRIAGALAGTLVVLLTYLIGLRLLRWRGAAALAGLLAAVDGLLFVQARISMLDVFLGLWVALAAWLLLVDHDRARLDESPTWEDEPGGQLRLPVPAGGSEDRPPPRSEDPLDDGQVAAERAEVASWHPASVPHRDHAFRLLAGVAFGLAIATKWSGVLALAAGVLVVLGWELLWRRRLTGRARTGVGRLLASLTLAFVVVPVGVYLVSYLPWLVNYGYTTQGDDVCADDPDDCYVSIPGRLAGLVRYQVDIAEFHVNLEAEHPYRAPAYTWPVLGRPVVYYWENCTAERARGEATENEEGELEEPEPCVVEQGNAAEIIAVGNPAVWWVALGAVLPLLWGTVRRDRRAWFIVVFLGMQFVPWLIVNRPVFFFYMTPVVPFLILAIAYAVTWMDEAVERAAGRRGRALRMTGATPGAVTATLVALVAVGTFIYFYPVYAGIELDYDLIRQRWWFDSWI